MDYTSTADALVNRIVALGPQILDLRDPWQLFKVPGFTCDDLGPSLAQASWALGKAKSMLEANPPRSRSEERS